MSLFAFAQKSDLVVTASTDQLTDLSKQLGLTGLTVSQKGNVYEYLLEGQEISISNYAVNLNGDKMTATESSDYIGTSYHNISLTLNKKDQTIMITNGFTKPFPIESLTEKTFSEEDYRNTKIAYSLLNEIANASASRSGSLSKASPKHTIVVINLGTSSSSAIGSTRAEAAQYITDHPQCVLQGTTQASCAWFFCVSTQTIQCP
jgi:hypothetical protein